MSYRAYKEKNGNYEIMDSKDEALDGLGSILAYVIVAPFYLLGMVIKLPFVLYDDFTSTQGELIDIDDKDFVLSLYTKEYRYPISDLEFIEYEYDTIRFKFHNVTKIRAIKIDSDRHAKKELKVIYEILGKHKMEVPLRSPKYILKWHEKYLRKQNEKR